MAWDLSCRDWEERIREGRSLIPDLPLVEDEANLAVAFFDELRLPDVPGAPRMGEAAGEWARDIVRVLFGSWDPATQTRYLREIFALIAKKNSKTTYLGAGLMLTALFMNKRARAEFIFAGPTQAIADLAYSQADGMIALDPELRRRFKRREHKKEIEDLVEKAKLKIRTFDLNILTGPRPAGAFVDELHLLGKKADTAKILRQLRGGRQSYPEGFLVIATTQSDSQPAGAFHEELITARMIRDGERAGSMLPVLYEFPDAIARDRDRWSDPANWPMVMPNLGRSLRLDSLVEDFETEAAKGDAALKLWASQHLNIEIGVGLNSDRWPGAAIWERRIDKTITLDSLIERCEVIAVGIDGGGMDDFLALCLIGREIRTGRWLVWNQTWVHRDALQQRKSEAGRFQEFERAGELVIVEELMAAYGALAKTVARVHQAGLLGTVRGARSIGLDPWCPRETINALVGAGVIAGEDDLHGIPQGWKLCTAIKGAEVKLDAGVLFHAGQLITAWAVGNAKVELRGNAVTITKQVAGTAKIDPLMAMFDAFAVMSMNPEVARSVYETRGLLVV